MAKEKKRKLKYDFASVDLLFYIREKRIPLGIITAAAFIISIFISLTITPLFKASVVMFPTTGVSVSKSLLADNYSGRYSIYEIGEEEQAEKMLQVLYSEEIRERITQKYKLMEHYGIDAETRFPKTKLYAKFKSNIRFRRTPYMSVIIEVMDKDPQMAADIANDISMLIDTVFNRMLKQRSIEAYQLVEKEYNELEDNMRKMQDSLALLRKLGINDYETQAERYHEALGKAILEGNNTAVRQLEDKLRLLSRYGSQYVSLRDQLENETLRLSKMKQKYTEARLEAEQTLPNKYIIDSAYKAEKKAYPKKSIIVIISTISSFLVGLTGLIIADRFHKKIA